MSCLPKRNFLQSQCLSSSNGLFFVGMICVILAVLALLWGFEDLLDSIVADFEPRVCVLRCCRDICWCVLYLLSSVHVFLTATMALHSKHIYTYVPFLNTSVKMAVRSRNMLQVYHMFVYHVYYSAVSGVCVCVCVCVYVCVVTSVCTHPQETQRHVPENGFDFLQETFFAFKWRLLL